MPSGQTETLKNAGGTALSTKTLSYTYDSLGNIETISEGGIQRQKYYYNSLNQLIREDNLDLNKTFVYSYDLGGNITSTAEYAYQTGATVTGTPTITNSYTYSDSNWKDKLTAYNGNSISYDAIGNPLSYYNGFAFTWQKGRQLASASNGTTSISYTYKNDGYRTSKTVNGTTTDYTLEGSNVLIEKTGSDYVWYYYDAAGAPVAMATGSGPSLYIYRKNLQGDITGIYSGSTGTLLVSYTYDAWGKVTATNVAGTTESATVLARNPYLYRGYRYDSETGLYYLNSRYYDPETGRFINADGFVSTGQGILASNMFAYCENNPVNRQDKNGQWGNIIIGALIGAIVGVVGQVVSDVVTSIVNDEVTISNWQTYTGALVGGAVGGAILGGTGNVALANAATGAVTTGVGMSLEKVTGASDKSWTEIGANTVADGVISYGLGKLPGVNNFTKGRNSMSAVYKSGLTKLRNGTATRMRSAVVRKGLVSSVVSGLAMDVYYGVKQYGYKRIKQLVLF